MAIDRRDMYPLGNSTPAYELWGSQYPGIAISFHNIRGTLNLSGQISSDTFFGESYDLISVIPGNRDFYADPPNTYKIDTVTANTSWYADLDSQSYISLGTDVTGPNGTYGNILLKNANGGYTSAVWGGSGQIALRRLPNNALAGSCALRVYYGAGGTEYSAAYVVTWSTY